MLRSVPGAAAVDGRPSARTDLDVVELDDGLVVYDPENDCVHYLNRVAAMVFLLCTGEYSAGQMADVLAGLFELEIPPRGDVETCLAQLRAARLLGYGQEFNDD